MLGRIAVIALSLVVLPRSATAITVGFPLEDGPDAGFFSWSGGFESHETSLTVSVDFVPLNILATADLTSGPLTAFSLVTDPNGQQYTTYTFSNGRLDIHSDKGSFTALIPNFTFTVREIGPGCPAGGAGECPGTAESLELGPGRFSRSLAQFLGVSRRSSGGSVWFYLESIYPDDPFAPERDGNWNLGPSTTITAVAPEPSLTALALLTGGMGLWRRRRTKTLPAERTLRH